MRWTASTISSNAVAMRIMRDRTRVAAERSSSLPAQPEVHFPTAALGAGLLVDQQRDVEFGVLANAAGDEVSR
jgi:hypothetical protein